MVAGVSVGEDDGEDTGAGVGHVLQNAGQSLLRSGTEAHRLSCRRLQSSGSGIPPHVLVVGAGVGMVVGAGVSWQLSHRTGHCALISELVNVLSQASL